MTLSAEQITIAIAVYKRRQFVKQAISSALNQSVPVRVIVVEDPGPDAGLESFIKDEFGSRIEYFKSPRWRGQWGTLNHGLEVCRTAWISFLHDDDFLAPGFVEAMVELARLAPDQALYFGRTILVNERGEPTGEYQFKPQNAQWHKVGLKDVLYLPPLSFPGQLVNVRMAREVGGFREHSYYCGDWEMWAKLIARGGAAQTDKVVTSYRCYDAPDRVTNTNFRNGRVLPVSFIQQKRILALLPSGSKMSFDRVGYLRQNPMSTKFLLQYGVFLRPRLLAYHVGLLRLSRPPHWRHALYRQCARIGGAGFVRLTSKLWNLMARHKTG